MRSHNRLYKPVWPDPIPMDDRTYVFETKRTRVAYSQDGRYVIVMEKRSILDTIKSAWEATRVRWPCLIVLGLMAYVVLKNNFNTNQDHSVPREP